MCALLDLQSRDVNGHSITVEHDVHINLFTVHNSPPVCVKWLIASLQQLAVAEPIA